jgi:peptidoglycan hydrolase-like protein with peptidoglycan-binding domain
MKYAIGTVAAVALGLSMAVSAQAQTPQHPMNSSPSMTTAPSPQARNGHAISQKEKIKQAQQALKAEGLYKGKVDGIWGSGSRQALMQFEKHNNLPATGKLDSRTFAALTQSTTPASIGSSTPHQQGSGQTNMTPNQTMPGHTPAPGAGSNGAAGAGGTQH